MIRHEIKYQFLRWKWLILLWWLLVLVDLGYQCQWWWDDGARRESLFRSTLSTPHDAFHRAMKGYANILLWLALALSAMGTFLGLAPEKSRSTLRIRPISQRDLFLSRISWLCLFFGTPWWIHEWIYLASQPKLSFGFCVGGVLLRIVQTLALWVACGAIGWAARNFWHALLIPVVGIASAWAIAFGIDYLSPGYSPADTALPPLRAPHFWILPPVCLCIALVPLLAFWWKRSSIRARQTKFWGTIALGSFLCLIAGAFSAFTIPKLVHWIALDRSKFKTIDSSFETQNREPKSSLHLYQEETPVARWHVRPEFKGLSPSITPAVHGSGSLTSPDGTEFQFFENATQDSSILSLNSRREVKELVAAFPDESIYTRYHLTEHSLQLDHRVESNYPGSLEGTYQGVADLEIDLWKSGEWHELPVDGHPYSFGNWKEARIVQIHHRILGDFRDWTLALEYYAPTPNRISDSVKKQLQFALLHRERKQLVLLSHDNYVSTQRGSFSTAPYVHMGLHASHQSLPHDLSEEWFKGAVLLMRESKYIGRSQRSLDFETVTFRQQDKANGAFKVARPRLNSDASSNISLENAGEAIRFDFNELDIISGSLNQELYELSRVLPETEVEVGVSDSVHSQIRQAILPYPALLDRFDSIWDENDRDWWLKQIAPNDQHPYRISALAARKGWFDDRPDTLATLIKDKTPIGAVALNTALGLDIPGARKLKFQRNLSTLEHPVSRKEFPDLWDDTKSRLEKSWQANQWTLQLASVSTDSTEFLNGVRLGRMGDEQVMRAVVNAYVNHGIVKQWQDSSDFESQWVHLLSSFESSADIPSTEPEKRVAQARAWLESDWTYLPNRMTYRLLP